MKRKIKIGKIQTGEKVYETVHLEIKLTEKNIDKKWQKVENAKCLSISGYYHNWQIDDHSQCSQMYDTMLNDADKIIYEKNWNSDKLIKLISIWKNWHLNDLNAGTPEQKRVLKTFSDDEYLKAGFASHYTWACKVLAKANLHPDKNGYRYGSAWLYEKIPQEAIDFIENL